MQFIPATVWQYWRNKRAAFEAEQDGLVRGRHLDL